MQEDKWSTKLGERLRKLQEEAPQPYLPGSWEAFEARRNQKRSIPLVWWWAGGIAASLALLFFVGSLWTGEQQEQAASHQLALETQVPQEESAALPAQSEGNPEVSSAA
jgi:type VI protein secretion system component VasF